MTRARPAVPRPGSIDPLIESLPRGTELVRIYDATRGPLDFNPTASSARFRPVYDRSRGVVPTAYGALDVETALAEGLLRGVGSIAAGTRRRLYLKEVAEHKLCKLLCTRPLKLVRLHGAGLQRLDLLREDVIDTEEDAYPYTAEWAQALWGSRRRPHGIAWTSRQNDSSRAVMLWADRVRPGWLEVGGTPIELDAEPGLEFLRRACEDAGIDFEG